MNKWLSAEFNDLSQNELFQLSLNRYVTGSLVKRYFKIFTPKNKESKCRVFYIADEGSSIVEALITDFKFKICERPDRLLITRIAGASNDRPWMLV